MLEILTDCINELCLYCGKYETEHEGSCDDCKYYPIKTGGYHRMVRDEQRMRDLAEDLQFNCNWCCCEDISNAVLFKCPFLKDDICIIGDPSTWDL